MKSQDQRERMLEQRTCLVTGGIGGIGTAICRRLAATGAHVIATYIPGEETVSKRWQAKLGEDGLEVAVVQADVVSFDSCTEMMNEVRASHGTPDVLVNAAGITRDATLRNMDPDEWQDVLRTNLDSVYNVTKQVVDEMCAAGRGRIINIASVNGKKGQYGQTNYSAAKAGIHGFTMSLAQEVARKGVTVNTISPGYVATTMVKSIKPDILEQIIAQIPVGRLAEPDEVARVVEFLAAEQSGFITGANIDINGGLWMH